jgi:hypothetical protein
MTAAAIATTATLEPATTTRRLASGPAPKPGGDLAQLAEIERLAAWLFAIARVGSNASALTVFVRSPPTRSGRRCLESPLAVCSRGGVTIAGRTAVPVET